MVKLDLLLFNNINLNISGPSSFDILEGHSKATMLLICNNAAQGILSSFFFKYAGKGIILGVIEMNCLFSWTNDACTLLS